jgi:transcription antitermination factor NusG
MPNQQETTPNLEQPQWYVLHCHPNKELFIFEECSARNIESYYPYLCVKPVNPRCRKIRPYFPGYIFVRSDLEKVGESNFRWLSHTYGLVSFGGVPTPVPEALVLEIKNHLEMHNHQEMSPDYHPGDRIQVLSEMFADYEAVFDMRLSGTDRVRVLLKMLNAQNILLELNRDQIKKRKHSDQYF